MECHFQKHREENGVVWFSSHRLNAGSGAVHGFSSRLGGTSKGYLSSLNLGTARGDSMENVRENFRRFGVAVGFDSKKTVFSRQVHRDDIRLVTAKDCGKGLYRERDYDSADGLITDCPGIPLAVFSADCIPILFHDPVRRAVGACHAGWRGTAMGIAGKIVRLMQKEYGCRPEHIRMAIGPGISRCCFETHEDVPQAMWAALGKQVDLMIYKLPNGKYLVDLKAINALWGQLAGVPKTQIEQSDACTSCLQNLFWSHRHTGEARGVMSAVIQLQE